MTTTELFRSPRAPSPTEPLGDARHNARPAPPANPSFGDALDETLSLVGLVPVAGPPLVLLAVPWLLFGLMLAGPFALLFALIVLIVAAWALVGLIGAILAAPFLLVRRLRGHATRRTSTTRTPAAKLVAVRSRWRAA